MNGEKPAEEPEEAQVLAFPAPERTCFECVNAWVSPMGTWCRVFDEVILTEVLTAQDCPEWELPK